MRLSLRELRRFAAVILSVVVYVGLTTSPAAADHDSGAATNVTALVDLSDWMSWVPDSTNLGDISIPMSHDSATATCNPNHIGVLFCRTQSMPISEQLKAGIRGLDIRILAHDGGTNRGSGTRGDDYLTIAHGVVDVVDPSTGQAMRFRRVLDDVCAFLAAHPTETIVMRIGDVGLENRHEVEEGGIDSITIVALNALNKVFNQVNCEHTSAQSNGIPNLGAVRGKVVFHPDASGVGGIAAGGILDLLGVSSNSSSGGTAIAGTGPAVANFVDEQLVHLDAADGSTNTAWHRTQFVANTGATPEVFAAGNGVWRGINERYVDALLGVDPRHADGVPPTFDQLGLVMMDYPSPSMIGVTIAANFDLAVRRADTTSTAQAILVPLMHHIEDDVDDDNRNAVLARYFRHVYEHPALHVSTFSTGDIHGAVTHSGFYIESGVTVHGQRSGVFDGGGDAPSLATSAGILEVLQNTTYTGSQHIDVPAVREQLLAKYPTHGVAVVHQAVAPSQFDLPQGVPRAAHLINATEVIHAWVYDGPITPTPVIAAIASEPEGTELVFNASGTTNPGNDPLRYRWDIDSDGTFDSDWSTEPRFRYTHTRPGTKTATLEVEHVLGIVSTQRDYIVDNVAPQLNLPLNIPPLVSGQHREFTGTIDEPGDGPFTITINWGDGSFPEFFGGVGPTFTFGHTFDRFVAGPVNIQFTVTDGDGESTSRNVRTEFVSSSLEVEPLPTVIKEGQEFTLAGTHLTPAGFGPFDVTIDWGDGTTDSEVATEAIPSFDVQHTYADESAPGGYQVTVTSVNGLGLTNTWTVRRIVGNLPPSIDIESVVDEAGADLIGGANPAVTGSPVSLTGTVSDPGLADALTVSIDWGENELLTAEPTTGPFGGTHTFTNAGEFTVTVTAADDDGGRTVATVQIVVEDPPSVAANVRAIAVALDAMADDPEVDPRISQQLKRAVGLLDGNSRSAAAQIENGDISAALARLRLTLNALAWVERRGSLDIETEQAALVESGRRLVADIVEDAASAADSRSDNSHLRAAQRLEGLGEQAADQGRDALALARWRTAARLAERILR
ncbi:MAG: PKD domain-containing protein [Acidimicrobiales bacterium]